MKINNELIAKAKQAKSAEELIALAKENGAQLTAEEANTYFDELNKSGELADDELDNVSGGGKCGTIYHDERPVISALNSCDLWSCEKCHCPAVEGLSHCPKCRLVNYCANCEYSRYEDALLLCYHPDRKDN